MEEFNDGDGSSVADCLRHKPITDWFESDEQFTEACVHDVKRSHRTEEEFQSLWHSVCQYFLGFQCNLNRGLISLNSVNQLIFVMVKYGVLFEVRTVFLNII
jgi:hypothetical protein